MNKFEKLIEYIINDEDDKARQLFHTIVVEKSRDIYENIMAEEMEEEGVHGYPTNDLEKELNKVDTEESTMENEEPEEEPEEEPMDNEFNLDHEDGEGNVDGEIEHDLEDEEHSEIEQEVQAVSTKLDDLLAKFDQIMGGGENDMAPPVDDEHGMSDMDEPMDEEMYFESKEEAEEKKITKAEKPEDGKANMKNKSNAKDSKAKDGKPFESRKSSSDLMREYVEKIADINLTPATYKEGDAVGTSNKTGKTKVNTKYTGRQDGPNFGGESVDFAGENENPDNKPVPKPNNEYNKGQGNLPGAGSFKNAPGNKKVWDGKEPAFKDDGDGQGRETGKKAGAAKDGNVSVNKKPIEGAAGQPTGKKQ